MEKQPTVQGSLWPLKSQVATLRRADRRGQGLTEVQGSLLATFGQLCAAR